MEDAKDYTERFKIERIVRANSGHVPVPISIVEKPGAEAAELADGAALWTKPRSEIKPEEYTDFYRNFGNFDEPALTVHFRAEGRHEFTALAFVPSSRPFDLYDNERKGRMKLYVKRVFITDDAEILPQYLRFVRGLVDSADLPLSLSREMIQQSPILAAIKKSVTGRVLSELEKLADSDAEAYGKIWDVFGAVIKEGIYEDYERRDTLLKLARFRTTASAEVRRSLKDYVAALKPNQTAIYYIAGDDLAQIEASPHLEGYRARGIEVLLLSDMVDSLWTSAMPSFDGKKLKSVTQGAADLAADPAARRQGRGEAASRRDRHQFHRLREAHARRRGVRRARVRPAHRQRGLPGRLRGRPRPLAGKAAARLRPRRVDARSPSSRSIRATASSPRWRNWATTRNPSRRTPRICCSTRRACSKASGRPTPRAFPTAWRG